MSEQPENAPSPDDSRPVEESAAVSPDAPTVVEPGSTEPSETPAEPAEPVVADEPVEAAEPAPLAEPAPPVEPAAPTEAAPPVEPAPPTEPAPPVEPAPPPEPAPTEQPVVESEHAVYTTLPQSPPPWTPPATAGAEEQSLLDERPEIAVGAAFAGGLVLALILKRLAR